MPYLEGAMDKLGLIDDSVDNIELRFSVKDIGDIPVWEWDSEFEDLRGRAERKARSDGEDENRRFIPPTPGVGLLPLVGSRNQTMIGDLTTAGFKLVESWAAKREMQNNMFGFYWMFCFRFVKPDPSVPFPQDRAEKIDTFYEPSLEKLVTEAMWRLRAFRNPGTGAREGRFGISINLEVREPYQGSDGRPITRRPVDENGRKIASATPVQVAPTKFLRLVDGAIRLG